MMLSSTRPKQVRKFPPGEPQISSTSLKFHDSFDLFMFRTLLSRHSLWLMREQTGEKKRIYNTVREQETKNLKRDKKQEK